MTTWQPTNTSASNVDAELDELLDSLATVRVPARRRRTDDEAVRDLREHGYVNHVPSRWTRW